MATLAEILSKKYPGRQWSIHGDDYSTLQFFDNGVVPTEAEMRAFSAEVDGLIATDRSQQRLTQAILADPGRLFLALDIVATALNELSAQLSPATATKVQALKAKLDAIRGG